MSKPLPLNAFILMGFSDVAIGAVLAGFGWTSDNTALLIVGVALALVGLGVMTVFSLRKGRPIEL